MSFGAYPGLLHLAHQVLHAVTTPFFQRRKRAVDARAWRYGCFGDWPAYSIYQTLPSEFSLRTSIHIVSIITETGSSIAWLS